MHALFFLEPLPLAFTGKIKQAVVRTGVTDASPQKASSRQSGGFVWISEVDRNA
jgi:hypothetical protein